MKHLLTLLLIAHSFVGLAKLTRVPFPMKVAQSALIIEGEVTSKTPALGKDGRIYEVNEIQVSQVFKNDANLNTSDLTIITWGGIYDGKEEKWHHAANLAVGQKFVGFLEISNRVETSTTSFEFYSGPQGRYLLRKDYPNVQVSCPFENYKTADDFFDLLSEYLGHECRSALFQRASDQQNCLEFSFETSLPNPLNPLVLDILVSIRTTAQDRLISEPVFSVNYNTSVLGSNVSSSGIVSLQDIGISSHVNYNSVIEDLAPDQINVRVSAINLSAPDLIMITSTFQPLVKLRIELPSLGDIGAVLNEVDMLAGSKYFDIEDEIEKHFDCIRVVGDIESVVGCSPEITNFFYAALPDQPLAGGVDLILTIQGTCFGSNESGNGRIEFTNAKAGPSPVEWVRAYALDVIAWTDDLIAVLVPNICEPSNGYPEGNAGRGNFRVNTGNTGLVQFDAVESNSALDINFSWFNRIGNPVDEVNTFNHSLPTYITNNAQDANFGGHLFYFDENFGQNYQPAFLRALNTWRCSGTGTRINIEVKSIEDLISDIEFNLATRVAFAELPIGVDSDGVVVSITWGFTDGSIYNCFDLNNQSQVVRRRRASELLFNSAVSWYTETETSGIDLSSLTDSDLESIALHEIGHWHGLDHTNDSLDVMYWTMTSSFSRALQTNDLAGGTYILERSMSLEFLALMGSSSCLSVEPHIFYNDCISQDVNDYLGISDMQAMFYPNPVSHSFTIEIASANFQSVEVTVYNLHGKLVKKHFMINNVETVDVSHLEPGVYLVSSSDGLLRTKLIKL